MANLTQLFKVAGITVHGDMIKVRYADDLVRRIKQFTKGGATRIDLIELPKPMTKVDALKFLQTHEDFQSPGDQATIADAMADRTPKEPKVKVTKVITPKEPKVKAVKEVKVKPVKKVVVKPSLADIKARSKKAKTADTVAAEEIAAIVAPT